MHVLDYLPIWAAYLLTIALGMLAVEVGFRLGKYWKTQHPDEQESHIGTMVGTTLGLWAFLLALLVGVAVNRYDERRALVLTEANSIGTTYLRAGFLPEPYASRSRELLREYSGERIKLVELDTHASARQRSEDIHPMLWSIAEEVVATEPATPILASYITSLNETIDLHAARIAALTVARLPFTIFLGIYVVAVVGLMMLGFQSGISGNRDLIVSFGLVVIFSTIMFLIIDLDRSWGGFLRVNQQPMIDLFNTLSNK